MDPFVALMRRYCMDYTNSQDQRVCDEIMEPEYVVNISGMAMPLESAYKPAVRQVYQRFPGLQLQVHELVTNGEYLAMRFSEHGADATRENRYGVWQCIGLYRWNGRRLVENWVEEDFLSQVQQLSSGTPAPLETPHLDPWVTTVAQPPNPAAEALARAWLLAGDLRNAPAWEIDDSWYGDRAPSPIEVEAVEINALFSAGDRVGFHVTQRGPYRGGLPRIDPRWIGSRTTLTCAGIAQVDAAGVRAVRVITDRAGIRRRLSGADAARG